jgi:hypothetical protein
MSKLIQELITQYKDALQKYEVAHKEISDLVESNQANSGCMFLLNDIDVEFMGRLYCARRYSNKLMLEAKTNINSILRSVESATKTAISQAEERKVK